MLPLALFDFTCAKMRSQMVSDSYGEVSDGCDDTYIVWEYFNKGYILVNDTVLQWKSESAIRIVLNRILTVHIHGVGVACFGCINLVGLLSSERKMAEARSSTGSASYEETG